MKITKPLSIGLLAGALSLMPMKKADASTYPNTPICDSSINCDFQDSGLNADAYRGASVDYTGGIDPFLRDGETYTIFGLFFGDENNTTIPSGWNQSVTTNSDSSENYTFTVTGSGNPINYWNSHSFVINFDGTEPAGIGSMALDSTLKVQVMNFNGDVFTGYTSAPDAITSNLEEFQNPAIVPEPVSSALFLTGGALLGYRGLRKKSRSGGLRKQRKGRR